MKILCGINALALALVVPLASLAQAVQHAPKVEAPAADYSAQDTIRSLSQTHDGSQTHLSLTGDRATSKRSYGSDMQGVPQAGGPREMTVSTYSAPIRVIGR